jgi:hypothetical protein
MSCVQAPITQEPASIEPVAALGADRSVHVQDGQVQDEVPVSIGLTA